MHTKLFILCLFGLSGSCITAKAQEHNIYTGFVGGYNSSVINNVDHIIISEPYFINGIKYRLTNKHIPGLDLGGFIDYEFSTDNVNKSSFFGSFEVRYSSNGTELNFSNSKDYYYKMRFNYQFINSALLIYFKLKKIFGGFGAQFSLNASPNNIGYTSYGPGKLDAFGTDLEQQQQLRDVLYGKSNFGLIGKVGFTVCSVVDVEARYNYGLKNIIEVQPNSYNFIQKQNHLSSIEFLLKIYLNRDAN